MQEEISNQITELQNTHQGLSNVTEKDDEIIVSGSLAFEASADGFETITSAFDIELIIPFDYPKSLPRAYETSGEIAREYEHVFDDKKLCLAVPIEERRIFQLVPTLLGFVNRLLVPYLYGYCYWREHKEHPFDESDHGPRGIVQYYREKLELDDDIAVLSVISFLYEHGYRGHHPCPCGSGAKVRNCHGNAFRDLYSLHTEGSLRNDFMDVLSTCLERLEQGEIQIPDPLFRQVRRILNSKK
ncbi:MAG: hypothetical protein ABW125_07210 [Candidatus Thiodiazotropha lotti]